MKEDIVYIKKDAIKEPPDKEGYYTAKLNSESANYYTYPFAEGKFWKYYDFTFQSPAKDFNEYHIATWLKPVPLSSLMDERVKFPLPSEWIDEFKIAWRKDNDVGNLSKKRIKELWAETERTCNIIYKYQRKAFEAKQAINSTK